MQKLNLSDIQKVAPVLEANNISLYDFKVNICYDTDLANLYFNDFKNGYINENVNLFFGNRSTDYVVIIENGTVANKSYYKKSQLARMNKDELYGLNYYYDLILWRNTELLKSELIENLLSVTNEYHYNIHFEKENYDSLDYDFAIRGYSQGDYCKVKIVGNVEKWINKDYLTNVFYDAPLTGSIEVICNGKLLHDFSLYDLVNFDEYASYSKSDIINMIAEFCKNNDYCNLLIEYLNNNLSDAFKYSY